MSPPIQKDWWLAAALTGAALPAAMGQVPAAAEGRPPAGIVTSVAQDASATNSSTPIYVDNASGQRLATGPDQTLHVLFSDQSAITLGPDSSLAIDEYRYDPETRSGALVMDLQQGSVRVVGGFISKQNETVVRSPGVGSIGIRGGITVVEHQGGRTRGVFLFGQSMRATDSQGSTQTVTRPGFGVDVSSQGVSDPQRLTAQDMNWPGITTAGSQREAAVTAPPAQNSSTEEMRGSGDGAPVSALANDRVKSPDETVQGTGPARTLQNVLGSGQTPNQS